MGKSSSPVGLREDSLDKLQRLADIMDNAFVIPGTKIRFGLDPIIGLVPGIGDTLSIVVSAYIYSFASRAGVPLHKRLRMLWNIFMDWFIGLVPLLGDILDVGFKANSRNICIIRAHADREPGNDVTDSEHMV